MGIELQVKLKDSFFVVYEYIILLLFIYCFIFVYHDSRKKTLKRCVYNDYFGGWLIVGKCQMSSISAIQVYVACFFGLCIFGIL